MAVVTSTQGGQTQFYKVPDDVLSKYKVQPSAATPEKLKQATGKDKPGKEEAHGSMPKSAMGGDVQGYTLPIGDTPFIGDEICWVETATEIIWWYC